MTVRHGVIFKASPDLLVAVECKLAKDHWKLTLADPPIAVSSETLKTCGQKYKRQQTPVIFSTS